MTNEKRPSDENDPEGIKQELFAAWTAEHPAGTRQQFDATWAAMTNEARPNDAPIPTSPARWDEGPAALKHKFFEEWKAGCPEGTMDQFEAAWAAVTG